MNARPKNGEPVWTGDEGETREHLATIANEVAALIRQPRAAMALPRQCRTVPVDDRALTIVYEPDVRRKQFLEVLTRCTESLQAESVERVFGRDAVYRWRRHGETIRERLDAEFSVTVIGPFKRGKSTLINALLEEEVVTSDIAPETVTINEIRWGETLTIEACLADGGRVSLTREQLKSEELSRVLSALPGVVTHLDVRAPVELLRGVCLVDTPGTGDLFQRFDRQVQDYLARTDAVLFVLSPLAPLSEAERAFLRLAVAPREFGKVAFVVNMLDKVHDHEDVAHVMQYLRSNIESLFPESLLFGVSALDELARVLGEPRLQPDRSLSLSAQFDALRAHVRESILDNRELIQIDRASAELKRLLQNVTRHAEQVQWAIESDQARLTQAIEAREDPRSALHVGMQEESDRLRQIVTAMGQETRDWLGAFMDRLQKSALALGNFAAEDLQRHFPFFLADALRMAMHCCLDAHRPLILAELRLSALPELALNADWPADAIQHVQGSLPRMLDAAVRQSAVDTSAAEATAGEALWDRLDLAKMLFDVAQTEVFGVAVALMRQLDESGGDRCKSLLYQQQFLNALPSLRRSVLDQVEQLYAGIAERLTTDIARAQRNALESSLDALRQGRDLATSWHDERQREVLSRVAALVADTQSALGELQRRWWPGAVEAVPHE
jgi:ribosome biogenesis GTPase A